MGQVIQLIELVGAGASMLDALETKGLKLNDIPELSGLIELQESVQMSSLDAILKVLTGGDNSTDVSIFDLLRNLTDSEDEREQTNMKLISGMTDLTGMIVKVDSSVSAATYALEAPGSLLEEMKASNDKLLNGISDLGTMMNAMDTALDATNLSINMAMEKGQQGVEDMAGLVDQMNKAVSGAADDIGSSISVAMESGQQNMKDVVDQMQGVLTDAVGDIGSSVSKAMTSALQTAITTLIENGGVDGVKGKVMDEVNKKIDDTVSDVASHMASVADIMGGIIHDIHEVKETQKEMQREMMRQNALLKKQ
ncbi:unnamed protein product [Chrysoparadoxa australica]